MFREYPPETLYAYPPATTHPIDCVVDALQLSLGSRHVPGKLAIYIHVPYCATLCAFCGFIKAGVRDRHEIDDFCRLLLREIDLSSRTLALSNPQVSAIYFGGGTASLLSLPQVQAILDAIFTRFNVSADAELTFEGECLSLKRDGYLEGLAAVGFTRLSYGVQTTDAAARTVLNLKPSLEDLTALADRARPLFADVCVDVIYGWPAQTSAHLAEDLERLTSTLNVNSIEAFAFEPFDAAPAFITTFQSAGVLMPDAPQLQCLRATLESHLGGLGYLRQSYTVYARLGNDLPVYNSCYYGWDGGEVLGFGRGAQSFFRGLMWGSSVRGSDYAACLTSGRLPYNSLATYANGERELITWPRRGTLARETVDRFGTTEYWAKLHSLRKEQLIVQGQSQYELSNDGWKWVPSIMHYLMPDVHATAARRISDYRASLRSDPSRAQV
jgi:oxygen-independent coproporphyrinogen-3 oxidase